MLATSARAVPPSGILTLQSGGSAKCLSVVTATAHSLSQATCNPDDLSQQFLIVNHQLISAAQSLQCVDTGTDVPQLVACDQTSPTQKWKVQDTETVRSSGTITERNRGRVFRLRSKATKKCLTVSATIGIDSATQIAMATCNNGRNQLFRDIKTTKKGNKVNFSDNSMGSSCHHGNSSSSSSGFSTSSGSLSSSGFSSSSGSPSSSSSSGSASSSGDSSSSSSSSGSSTSSNADAKKLCLSTVNQLRATKGLSPLVESAELENDADAAPAYDQSHGGAIHSHARLLNVGENEYQESPPTDPSTAAKKAVAAWWSEGPSPNGQFDEQHGHYMNLVNSGYTQGGCGFGVINGWIYVYMDFK